MSLQGSQWEKFHEMKHMEEDLRGKGSSLEIQNITASSCWLHGARAIIRQKTEYLI